MVIQVTTHEFILSFCRLLENLQNNSDEETDEDSRNNQSKTKEVNS